MKGITVDELAQMCLRMSAKGLGSKKVLMSSDDECNEYHQAWEGLTEGKEVAEYIEQYQLRGCASANVEDYVVLT